MGGSGDENEGAWVPLPQETLMLCRLASALAMGDPQVRKWMAFKGKAHFRAKHPNLPWWGALHPTSSGLNAAGTLTSHWLKHAPKLGADGSRFGEFNGSDRTQVVTMWSCCHSYAAGVSVNGCHSF